MSTTHLDQLDTMSAVVEHARRHGDLAATILSVGVGTGRAVVHLDASGDAGRADLVRWARSIGATEVVEDVTTLARGFKVLGHLVSGVPVTVRMANLRPADAPRASRLSLDEFAGVAR